MGVATPGDIGGTPMIALEKSLERPLVVGEADQQRIAQMLDAALAGQDGTEWPDFVRDVPRSHVLTLRWIMRPARPDDVLDGPELGPDVVVRAATRAVLAAEKPVKVVKDGQLLGIVGDEEILAIVAGTI